MKPKAWLAASLICILLLSGCVDAAVGETDAAPSAEPSQTPTVSETETPAVVSDNSDMFSDRDLSSDYDASAAALIRLNGDSAECDSDAVQISGSTVTVTDEGVYILTGTLNDGTLIVNADATDKPQLVLDGVSITCETSAAIYIEEADKVVITLAAGSENVLNNGGSFSADDSGSIDGAVFSRADLSFNGSGSLSIASPAGHGIVCKDDLVFAGGTYAIGSASHGIDANDSVRATGSELSIVSGKDGIHAENADDASLGFIYVASGVFSIEAEGDGLSAGASMRIEDGSFDVVSGGGSANAAQATSDAWGSFGGHGGSFGGHGGGGAQGGQPSGGASEAEDSSTSIKGLKAAGDLVINGGTFTVDAADDAVHSNASITVNGGAFDLRSGDDGLHADETVTVAAGTVSISESYEGIEGLHVAISGGSVTLFASDDGLNAAGGVDESGFGGQRGNEQFGGNASASAGSIVISGGSLYINAEGDGLDANGTLEISGGDVIVSCPTSGDTAVLDFDTSGSITGGTFIGTGAAQMAQTFSASEQGVLAVSTGKQAAGTAITLTDSDGNVLLSRETDRSFAVAILSAPSIAKGATYTLSVGSESEKITAN